MVARGRQRMGIENSKASSTTHNFKTDLEYKRSQLKQPSPPQSKYLLQFSVDELCELLRKAKLLGIFKYHSFSLFIFKKVQHTETVLDFKAFGLLKCHKHSPIHI